MVLKQPWGKFDQENLDEMSTNNNNNNSNQGNNKS